VPRTYGEVKGDGHDGRGNNLGKMGPQLSELRNTRSSGEVAERAAGESRGNIQQRVKYSDALKSSKLRSQPKKGVGREQDHEAKFQAGPKRKKGRWRDKKKTQPDSNPEEVENGKEKFSIRT